ncbi:MAG: tetratricopeptide repeat protein [Deltaproteobacteria bacterium]|nr:tetratricopeptide repeat protein [Deltaproteobacteria bacterium]
MHRPRPTTPIARSARPHYPEPVLKAEVDRAEALLRNGRPSEAIEVLRTLLSRYPDDPDLRRRLAEAYQAANNQERAFHHFNRAAQLFSSFGKTAEAVRMWVAADAVSKNEPDVLFRLAQAQLALGESNAIRDVLSRLVVAASATKDRRRVFALDALHRLEPTNLSIAIKRAHALEEVDRLEDAFAAWLALDAVPEIVGLAERHLERPNLSVKVVDVLLERHRPHDALRLARSALEHHPEDVEVVAVVVRALETLGPASHLIAARIALANLLARDPRAERTRLLDEAARLTAVAASNPEALEAASAIYAQLGMEKEFIQIELRLAQLHDAKGRKEARDRALARVLKIDPQNREGLRMGVRSLREAGDDEQAQALEGQLFAAETRASHETDERDTHLRIELDGFDDPADATTSRTTRAVPPSQHRAPPQTPGPPSSRHLASDLLAEFAHRPGSPDNPTLSADVPTLSANAPSFAPDKEPTAPNERPDDLRPRGPRHADEFDLEEFDQEAPTLSHKSVANPDTTES